MSHSFSRRRLLHGAVKSGAAAGVAMMLPRAAWAADAAPQAPLPVTCRDAMLAHIGETNCWTAMTRVGVDGVEALIDDELALPGLFHPDKKYTVATAEGRRALKDDMQTAGKQITAFCMFTRYEERPDFEVEWGRKVAEAADAMAIPAARIDVVPRKLERPAFLQHATAVLRRLIAATEGSSLRFGIENHGNTTNDPQFLDALFDAVGSARLGLTLDTGNFYWFGHPLSKLYEIYEHFAPRVVHTHCKSIGYPADEREKQRTMGWRYGDFHGPITTGDIDFARVVAILKKAGYRHDLCLENESLRKLPPAEAAEVVAQEASLLKKLR
jgi:sugar phosphate isomerase/epimerase